MRSKIVQMPMWAHGDPPMVSATRRDSSGSECTSDVNQDPVVQNQGSESTDLHRTGLLRTQDNGVGSGPTRVSAGGSSSTIYKIRGNPGEHWGQVNATPLFSFFQSKTRNTVFCP